MQPSTPRGVRDYGPSEAISLRYMVSAVEEIFKRFGFYPMETPAIENLSVLDAKSAYSDEQNKEIFRLDGEEAGLRYDMTVPLARYVASNRDIVLPFKRYQIANSYRKDEPQKLRYREFMQADVDVIGSAEVDSDAEVIAATLMALERLGIGEYSLLINSRPMLQRIMESFGIPKEKESQAIRMLDKLQKIGKEGVSTQMEALGIAARPIEELLRFVGSGEDNGTKLDRVAKDVPGTKEEAQRMSELLDLLTSYGLSGRLVVDFSLARGFDYYTGFVWEAVVEEGGKRLPTLLSGGRYDNLIGTYSSRALPAVGSSIGLSRVFDVLGGKGAIRTHAKVFVAFIGDNKAYAASVANALRGGGIYTDLNYMKRNISRQLEYAGALGIRYVAIVGDREKKESRLNLRDMVNGTEEMLTAQEAVEKLKE